MDLSQLIAALRQPAAYPHPVAVVFLAGAWAYKIKKPCASLLWISALWKRGIISVRRKCG
jgi:aminoglycoside phosphotransferase family enzyme